MFPSAGDELRIKPGGVLLAVVAFILTRTLLVGVLFNNPVGPISVRLLRLIPLVVGLGLVIYGVNLAVSTHSRAYARTVVIWFLAGSIGIFAMVALGAIESSDPVAMLSSDIVVANAVLGGGSRWNTRRDPIRERRATPAIALETVRSDRLVEPDSPSRDLERDHGDSRTCRIVTQQTEYGR
jgi:hypothetical protein